MTEHTPTPWVVDDPNTTFIAQKVGDIYEYIADFSPDVFSSVDRPDAENEANAAFAVKAVNAYDDLVAMLKDCKYALNGADVSYQRGLVCQIKDLLKALDED